MWRCVTKRCSAPRSDDCSENASSAARASFSSIATSRTTICSEACASSGLSASRVPAITCGRPASSTHPAADAAQPLDLVGRERLGPEHRVFAADARARRPPAAGIRSPNCAAAPRARRACRWRVEVGRWCDSAVCELISRSTCMLREMLCEDARLLVERRGNVLHEARDLVRHLLDLLERSARILGEQRARRRRPWCCAPSTTTASLVSAWIVRTSTSICLVAFAERSASRCTSSATTAKPRPGLAGHAPPGSRR